MRRWACIIITIIIIIIIIIIIVVIIINIVASAGWLPPLWSSQYIVGCRCLLLAERKTDQ